MHRVLGSWFYRDKQTKEIEVRLHSKPSKVLQYIKKMAKKQAGTQYKLLQTHGPHSKTTIAIQTDNRSKRKHRTQKPASSYMCFKVQCAQDYISKHTEHSCQQPKTLKAQCGQWLDNISPWSSYTFGWTHVRTRTLRTNTLAHVHEKSTVIT